MNPADIRRIHESRVEDHATTRHARERMAEFGLTPDDLALLLRDYEQRYQQGHRSDQFVHQRGQWAMVVDPTQKRIITVLRRKIKRWEH